MRVSTSIHAPFVLHLGSNAAYKNREGVLRVFAKAAAETDLQLVIAGEALNRKLARLARELQIEDRIVQVVKPDVALIEALYNRAALPALSFALRRIRMAAHRGAGMRLPGCRQRYSSAR